MPVGSESLEDDKAMGPKTRGGGFRVWGLGVLGLGFQGLGSRVERFQGMSDLLNPR